MQQADQKPKLFIGSSTKGLEVARAIQTNLAAEVRPLLWSQGFALSKGNIENLESQLDQCELAVLVMTPDDLAEQRDEVGLPTDLDGITCASYDPDWFSHEPKAAGGRTDYGAHARQSMAVETLPNPTSMALEGCAGGGVVGHAVGATRTGARARAPQAPWRSRRFRVGA